jgi:tetratricopeptide (TPR) repeat protein
MNGSKLVRSLYQGALALTLALAASISAIAQGGVPGYPDDPRWGYDPREIAMLPRYCIYTQAFRGNVPESNDPEQLKRWNLLLGASSFNALHHYCWGLMKTNRALFLVRTERFRIFYLNDSIQEFDYVINRVPPEFKLLPEILTKKGENLIRLRRDQEGILQLQRAIGLKPDYWPPYAAISDYYKERGNLAKAREWLEEGLSASPEVKALKRRRAELDAAKDKPAR